MIYLDYAANTPVDQKVLKAYKEALEQGKSARTVTFDSEDEIAVSKKLFLLTTKPVLYVCNVDENSAVNGNAYVEKVKEVLDTYESMNDYEKSFVCLTTTYTFIMPAREVWLDAHYTTMID